ncbi:MAG: hypothetical protein U5L05_09170 [Rubrivivax sp.]|nr:hypothetical protein [Rubrivivax sp.]
MSERRSGETPRPDRLACADRNPVAAKLLFVRRFLAIFLLALLPIQFSWAAVASYCAHELQADAAHFGHHEHEHQHPGDAGPAIDAVADAVADTDAQGDSAPGAVDLDCGHCHGTCGVMVTVPPGLPGTLSSVPPSATLDEAGGAHAPTRPERPQWLPLA